MRIVAQVKSSLFYFPVGGAKIANEQTINRKEPKKTKFNILEMKSANQGNSYSDSCILASEDGS